MRKIEQFCIYRKCWIYPYNNKGVKGWSVDNDLNIYVALSDCKNAINKYLDCTHKAEPRIIGQWEE